MRTHPINRRALLGGSAGLALGAAVSGAAGATSASGAALPVGDLPGWKQVIREDFTTAVPRGGFVASPTTYGELATTCAAYRAYGRRLGVYGNGPVNTYGYYDVSKTLSTSGSLLDMYLHHDTATNRNVSAAVFPFRAGSTTNAHLYGRWSYRMRSYNATGTNWACVSLLWPDVDSQWPMAGEIDWPEGDVRAVPSGARGNVAGFFHPRGAQSGHEGTVPIPGLNGLWTNWHTYTIEWLPNSLKCYLNNHLVLSRTTRVPSTPMRWITQSCPSNDNRGAPLRPAGSAHVQIDWVVAYDRA
ncbi:glycoside hydrolase family 16 protein [Allobranchiibius sp. GilTou73]|uniref:glycoside hydrolase family 16 protein n=1 Tax=Allobranchiibius sp. GilTou73 TaxID=2904523 RepID=UPI001F2F4E0E|nr:glycoside hydrolase family 16 protein [Allobranchiibius sp. GilTou73]UIJ36196.1 glycoside hydrolase family 16 protein [Allobranchiibius sp. GilTou73]